MGRHLHFDCFSGVSGDMVLGALVSAGLSWTSLVDGLKRLKLRGYRLQKREVHRGALPAIKVDVIVQQGFQRPLTLSRIRKILADSTLPGPVKERSRSVFDRLAEAEGVAHGVDPKDVHFHEVGVVDSFIDVVGGVLGCYLLNATRVTASPINVGAGSIQTSHGLLPVPGPAVAALARGVPIYADGPRCELATPTGVALLRTLASEFGPLPRMRSMAVGYGAGDHDPDGWPNVLRLFVEEEPTSAANQTERMIQIETNLDDLSPQTYEYIMEQLFQVGAIDVVLAPVVMKKSRPGILLSCLATEGRTDAVIEVLFQETTTLGVRLHEVRRRVLTRRFVPVTTQGGVVRMKVAEVGAGWEKAAPEYEDCKAIAQRTGHPLKTVMEEALMAYRRGRKKTRITTARGRA
ncbi:MAG: nickel pincer cofactor biosynthesis protein LarC [Nitrospira sp. CG24B]|nr:MAG: nickel pincer cofactor biosynthesis protein LarC [Nitrospira sp. CG24B]